MSARPDGAGPAGDHSGVLDALVRGEWEEPGTGVRHGIPIDAIAIRDSLDGAEAELVAMRHPGESLVVVSDPFTRDALGRRVLAALETAGLPVTEFVWEKPSCCEQGVETVREATRGRDALIAVGSGTINDTVKYASWLDGRPYSVFPTSPMNAYTTSTASVAFGGFKKSITCHGARGVFFDLSVLARCPPRLVSAAFADVICRTTAQVDWLLSHLLFDTAYAETPYALLAIDEPEMIRRADEMLAGDTDALALLTRIAAIMGLGTSFTVTTHSGSMHEHMISHYIDMFAGDAHPGSSHGEQVGVATVTMSRLQNAMLGLERPPELRPTAIPEARLRERFAPSVADNLVEQSRVKALDARASDALNARLERDWSALRARLGEALLPFDVLHRAMGEAGCRRTASELELDPVFYREAVANARWTRDRYGMLDLAGDAILPDDGAGSHLEAFVESMPT